MPQVPVPFKDLELLFLLGSGCYGRVFVGMYRPSTSDIKHRVAVKVGLARRPPCKAGIEPLRQCHVA